MTENIKVIFYIYFKAFLSFHDIYGDAEEAVTSLCLTIEMTMPLHFLGRV